MTELNSLKEKHVLVVGLGISGQAAAQFLLKRGAHVTACDRNKDIITTNDVIADMCLQGLKIISEEEATYISPCDLVVVSPGIPQTHPVYRESLARGLEVIGEVELACREIKQKCLAVTGTNGKTTVTLLVEHVLKTAGRKVKALGNVGTPLTSALEAPEHKDIEIFVIELSSFQLETLVHPFIDAGVLLNITPDHLDRYPSMKEYAAAKVRMKGNLKIGGSFFVEEHCYKEFNDHFGKFRPQTYGYSSNSDIYVDSGHICYKGKQEVPLPASHKGKRSHDVENVMAAYALCREVGISGEQFAIGLSSFKKPAHRIEFVRTHAGIHYVDDSKGTNIDAVIRAVASIEGRIVLIAGGVDKGFPYTSWIDAFGGKVKSICAIGQSKEKIKQDLGSHLAVELFSTLQEAVAHAAKVAESGETVLLSPGCSSYDMFTDYAHRGYEFQRIIHAL